MTLVLLSDLPRRYHGESDWAGRLLADAGPALEAGGLFSYDNHPVAFPGDQQYCASGYGVVGGQVVGPGSGCESDARL